MPGSIGQRFLDFLPVEVVVQGVFIRPVIRTEPVRRE